ncbi:SCO3374 family protein [Streptomyces sp. NPDC003011]
MVGTLPPVTTDLPTVPLPRRPLDPSDEIRRWYENELGWPTVPASARRSGTPPTRGAGGTGRTGGTGGAPVPADNRRAPVRLFVGLRFDVLDVPAEAGRAALRHLVAGSPVALQDGRMRFLVAAGSAEELPGLLDWLEWGAVPLDLTMTGEGGVMDAPAPPARGPRREPEPTAAAARPPHEAGPPAAGPDLSGPEPAAATLLASAPAPAGPAGARPIPVGRCGDMQGAAVWVRPPEPGCEVEASLPTMSAMGGGGGAPDLVRLLSTVATQCHRLRLRRAFARPSTVPRTRH